MDKYKVYLENIGLNVRNIRFKQKISQEKLAEKAGFSTNTISNIENAKCDIGICTLYAVADALGVSISDFIS